MWCEDGWTVTHRRTGPELSFHRTWAEYRDGFGDISGDHWLGNEIVHLMTYNKTYKLRLEFESYNNNSYWVEYDDFYLSPESDNYTLYLNDTSFVGNVSEDSMINHYDHQFTTHDRDNDRSGQNCAILYQGGWWFYHCADAVLTAWYPDDPTCTTFPARCFKYAGITGVNCDTGCLLKQGTMKIKATG
ncbi:angiopoietin-related protein 1-like [Lingula anatina]|uniref:Angiopoietin-related protein 1-like n=1 Tax=Lingula anatina TaxID=7574 RepID=A0A1S3K8X2_LINAN|nr:angiopoietin-related protein 1-like [Lingula anatina]|eukprot:XP_013418899.1 angiopoietin-related protein 1-like [Lingula anatina]